MKKHLAATILFLAMLTLALLPSGCSIAGEATTPVIDNISIEETYSLILSNEGNPDLVILDVRTPEEFAEGHLANAINIDYKAECFDDDICQLDRDKIYIVYCLAGSRGEGARDVMAGLGFCEVHNITGGISAWAKQYPYES